LIWRKSLAICIPKVGKDDYSSVRSFRPISLSSFLFKGMERIVGWHLEETSLKTQPISPNQHAFTRGKGTETALSSVVDKIESKILRNQFVLGVFLDIEGAFDHLSPGGVNASMVARGFPEEVTNWYGHYLENREVQIELRGTKLTRHLTRGSSQGGVISPTAWNVNFESLLKILDHGPATSVGYADDAVMLLAGSDPDLLIDRAQPYLVKALQWGNDNGLTFSSSKTVAVMFTRKKWNTEKTLIMDGSIIEFSNQVKYLGLTLTSDLSWSTHINNKIKSCKWKLMQLRAAVGIRWGPRPDLMAWAYKGIILPVLTYGALVWAHRKIPDYLVSRLT
jgi:hypothetical protein